MGILIVRKNQRKVVLLQLCYRSLIAHSSLLFSIQHAPLQPLSKGKVFYSFVFKSTRHLVWTKYTSLRGIILVDLELTSLRCYTCLTIAKYKNWFDMYWLLEFAFQPILYLYNLVFILIFFFYFTNNHLQNILEHWPTKKGNLILKPCYNIQRFSPRQVGPGSTPWNIFHNIPTLSDLPNSIY